MDDIQRMCVLHDQVCIGCGECERLGMAGSGLDQFGMDADEDDRCDLDPDKICDNCMKCINGDSDYRAIILEGIVLSDEEDAP
ncbi:MAG: hypothetical protein ACI4MJ_11495 [Aristaeellaceae bacterium]